MTRSQDLRRLMDEHGIDTREVARLTEHSHETVRGWLTPEGLRRHREPSRQTLKLLRLELERRE